MSPHLSNPDADRVKMVRKLAGRSARRRAGSFLVEGPQCVREALRARCCDQVYATHDALARDPRIAELFAEHPKAWTADDNVLAAMGDAQTSQGVVAVCPMPRAGLDDVFGDFVVVLVEVQDPGNVGTIIRAADAAGASGVVLTQGCVDVFNPKCVRSTAGSLFHLPVSTGVGVAQVMSAAATRQVEVLGTSGYGDTDVFSLSSAAREGHGPLAGPHAWFVGNEAAGLPDEVLANSTGVRIPLRGGAESLNAAMAATVCLFTSAQVRENAASPHAQ